MYGEANAATPPIFRSVGTGTAISSSTLTITTPAGVTLNDVMVAHITFRRDGIIATPPAGWTLIREDDFTGENLFQALYYRVATTSEPPDYTWSFDDTRDSSGAIAAYGGVNTGSPIDAHGGQMNMNDAAVTAPSITTTVADTTLVGFFGIRQEASFTSPAGMSERWDVSTAGIDSSSSGADEAFVGPGATGPRTATSTQSSDNIGQLIALTPTAPTADLTLSKTDSPDPAPAFGPLLYTLLVTNNGPSTATNVSLVDTLPASVTLVSATPSQGSCSGAAVVTCDFGSILNSGTASVEILVTTGGAGTITNNATVGADEPDPVPADNAVAENTDVVVGGTTDIPLTQYVRMAGFLDSVVTGGSLRAQPNGVDPCALNASSAQNLAGIPGTATVRAAYLYWAGSGSTVDANVTLDAASLVADRTWTGQFVLGANNYDFFGGFKDVTAQVDAKRNGLYTFGGLTVDDTGIYCAASAVISGWSLIVVYEDTGVSGKTLVLYDGFDITRNGSTNYLLSGIYASGPTEAKTSTLLWEGDDTLSGVNEQLLFNATPQFDALNPVNNVYNSTINSIGDSTTWGMDLDTFDVSGLVSVGDTLATTQVDTGPDLVILNSVLLQVKTNVIVGTVFEDVNYGGGVGRNLVTAKAVAPTFAVERPAVTVELYDAGGNLLRTTVTDAAGGYGFTGLPDGNYTVRVVNDTVRSSRPGATGTEWPVQTFRTDATGASTVAVTSEVGGADPTAQDDPANGGGSNLAALTAQSLAPVTISAALTKSDVDFGFNFDTVVNTNNTGQGSLRAFIDNSNALTNANLDQAGLTAGKEHSVFMIPSDADPLGRPQDPNFDAGRGVAVITLTSALPAIGDADTAVDGSTQTNGVGNTNAGLLGTGGTVGTDALALAQVAAPEIEIRAGAVIANGLQVQANDSEIRALAMLGFGAFGGEGAIRIDDGFSGTRIEDNVLGSLANVFADPGVALRDYAAIDSQGGDGGTIRNNLIGFTGQRGVFLDNGSDSWTVEGNEFRDNGLNSIDGDGLAVVDSDTNTLTGNLITGTPSQGIVIRNANANIFTNNTVTGNGVGTAAGVLQSGAITMRPGASGTVFDRNIVQANYGAGLMVNDGAATTSLTRNSFRDNGTIVARDASPPSGQIGIDLNAPGDDMNLGTPPYVTPNDAGDGDTGGNTLLNFPVPASAVVSGGTTTVVGTLNSAPGTTYTLEFFSTVTADPSGHGEGEVYRGTDSVLTDGGGNAGFSTVLPVAVPIGHAITMTSTDPAGTTSEFSSVVLVGTDLEIVKRAFFVDGTPIPSGATIPNGVTFHFLLYINNPNGARSDLSIRDVFDPAFAYQAGSMTADNSVANCAAAACTPVEETTIFAAAAGGSALTDEVDGDVARYDGGSTSIDAGDQNAANAQLDIAANRVWALLFDVKMQ